jgi:oligoendopeptidase F
VAQAVLPVSNAASAPGKFCSILPISVHARLARQLKSRRQNANKSEALQMAGVDLASPEPVERAFAVLSGLVDRLEKLIVG